MENEIVKASETNLGSLPQTPDLMAPLSRELESVIAKRNLLTCRTRRKVLEDLRGAAEEEEDDRVERLRKMAVNEVISSERSYLRHLEIVQEYFASQLQELKILPHKDFVAIFGDIPCILQVNKELLHCLETAEDKIGSVFLQLAPYLKFYSTYASDFEKAAQLVEKWNTKSKAFKSFVSSQESRPEVQLKLNSLLITPIQRVPRYKMLLEDVIKKTPDNHIDKVSLKEALKQIEDVAKHIEERLKEHEMAKIMLNIQKSLAGNQPNIISPGRRLLKQGKLMKVPRAGGTHGQQRYFVLFSDILMYCKLKCGLPNNWTPPRAGALECGCVLPLKAVKAEMLVGKGVFKLTCQKEELILYSVEGGSAQEWVDAIKDAINQYKRNASTLRKESSKREPLKRPDLMKMRRESLTQLMRCRLVEGRNKLIQQVTPNSALKKKLTLNSPSVLKEHNSIDASPKLKPGRKRKLTDASNKDPATNTTSTPISKATNHQENMDICDTPREDSAKRRKSGNNSKTPARDDSSKAPELTPQSQVQLRAKSGRLGPRAHFKSLSLKSFASFKQEHIKRESRRGKASLFRSPSIYEEKAEEEDEGQSKFLATYLSGKLCPLTPSQRPTNVEHLVVSKAPSTTNLNLKGEKEFNVEQKSENRVTNDKSEQSEATKNIQNGVSSEQKSADEQDMDSSGYCSIM